MEICPRTGWWTSWSQWRAFNWDVQEVDGHDIPALNEAFAKAQQCDTKPSILIAHTVKGKGIDFMECQMVWHYYSLTEETYQKARGALSS